MTYNYKMRVLIILIQNMAVYMMAGKYRTDYRIQNYEPYREVSYLALELKTSTYNQFENPTGIFNTLAAIV